MFAIQARGLYGDDEPHRRFEDMARAYLQEIRSLQPEGPYYLGGFSGGGVTAFEMAQQLLEQGEEVGMLLMLDSMPPFGHHQTIRDRIEMKLHDLRREGLGFFPRWARSRFEWELVRLRKRFVDEPRELTPGEFRSEQIEIAFREALANYRPKAYPGKLILFRPPPERRWVLSGGRILNSDRYFADHHNHWKPYVEGGIDVHVVSGDHDAMVLEPHVRILAAKFRACLEDAQRIKFEEDQL